MLFLLLVSCTKGNRLKLRLTLVLDVKNHALKLAALATCSLLVLSAFAYLFYLQVLFPKLVPSYGSGERFTLELGNNYTYQIPWHAITKLHLGFQTNDTVKLYANKQYVCDCTSYQFTVEPDDTLLIRMEANSPVSGMFTAWQETPLEKQLLAITLLSIGLVGVAISVISLKKK
jgi:hypothetical protein